MTRICRSISNAELMGLSHPAEVAGLLMVLSQPAPPVNRGRTPTLLFMALAAVMWATDEDAELWRRLRDVSAHDGLTKYLHVDSLDLLTPDAEQLAVQNVTAMHTAAALCIILTALSDGSTAEDAQRPARGTSP